MYVLKVRRAAFNLCSFEVRHGEAHSGTDKHGDFSDGILCQRLPCLQRSMGAVVGERLECQRECDNPSDIYAVAVKTGGTVVGLLPRKLSRLCALFIRRGGSISCSPTGRRRYSSDLPQGGLEIPCLLFFEGDSKEINL